MKQTARMLRDQAKDLKVIAGDTELRGRYADKLRDASRDLEVHLRETAGRYERVQGHLTGWAGELEDLQTEADTLLKTAQADTAAAKAPQESSGSSAGDTTTGQEDDPAVKHRVSLEKIVARRDDRAGHFAGKIRHELNDKIKDSRWENFKDTVSENAGWIKVAIDVLSYAATIVAIVALFCTPVGWVAMAAIAATALVLVGHTVLALAGEGSWMDVGMDVFALATFGTGKIALKGLKGIQSAMRGVSTKAAGKAAEKTAHAANRASRAAKASQTESRTTSAAQRRGAEKARDQLRVQERKAAKRARRAERDQEMPEATSRDALSSGGDREAVGYYKDIQRMRQQYPDNAALHEASAGAERYNAIYKRAWGAGTAADSVDKAAGSSDLIPDKFSVPAYSDFKDQFTHEVGSKW
ncbi:hypothetical protein [Streptomyces sp. H39-S7]|uniref:hypothetical protein n=1 Tax=Streptomyces sp. H39-S7 TaxID=3004357 RepID=UPI0022B012FA|nr:hypothetical protein [Streptomyces sp. H39-S7]MCZ4118595.1 hypothetical protein [Streptomyces sp. H39-S7]